MPTGRISHRNSELLIAAYLHQGPMATIGGWKHSYTPVYKYAVKFPAFKRQFTKWLNQFSAMAKHSSTHLAKVVKLVFIALCMFGTLFDSTEACVSILPYKRVSFTLYLYQKYLQVANFKTNWTTNVRHLVRSLKRRFHLQNKPHIKNFIFHSLHSKDHYR